MYGFWNLYVPLLDKCMTGLGMWEASLAAWPCCKLTTWKCTIDSSHSSLCPLLLYVFIHAVLKYRLYKTMDCKRLQIWFTMQKRESAKISDGSIKLNRV